jgi:phage shock protein PspC (stress-responsive transcriptional regulator)
MIKNIALVLSTVLLRLSVLLSVCLAIVLVAYYIADLVIESSNNLLILFVL